MSSNTLKIDTIGMTICFILDATMSMIEAYKGLRGVITSLVDLLPLNNIRICILIYTDFGYDHTTIPQVVKWFSGSINDVIHGFENVALGTGYDWNEAVSTAYFVAIKKLTEMSEKGECDLKNTLVIHIADAPPHYTHINNFGDFTCPIKPRSNFNGYLHTTYPRDYEIISLKENNFIGECNPENVWRKALYKMVNTVGSLGIIYKECNHDHRGKCSTGTCKAYDTINNLVREFKNLDHHYMKSKGDLSKDFVIKSILQMIVIATQSDFPTGYQHQIIIPTTPINLTIPPKKIDPKEVIDRFRGFVTKFAKDDQTNDLLACLFPFAKIYYDSIRKCRDSAGHSKFIEELRSFGTISSSVIKAFKDAQINDFPLIEYHTKKSKNDDRLIFTASDECFHNDQGQLVVHFDHKSYVITQSDLSDLFTRPPKKLDYKKLKVLIQSLGITSKKNPDTREQWNVGIPITLITNFVDPYSDNGKEVIKFNIVGSFLMYNPQTGKIPEYSNSIDTLLVCSIIRWGTEDLKKIFVDLLSNPKFVFPRWLNSTFNIPDTVFSASYMNFIKETLSMINPKNAEILRRLSNVCSTASITKYSSFTIKHITKINDVNAPIGKIISKLTHFPMAWCSVLRIWYVANIMVYVPHQHLKTILDDLCRHYDFYHFERFPRDHFDEILKMSEKFGGLYISAYAAKGGTHPDYRDDFAIKNIVKSGVKKFPKKESEYEEFYLDRIGVNGERIFTKQNMFHLNDFLPDKKPQWCICRCCESVYLRQDSSTLGRTDLKCFDCREIRWVCQSDKNKGLPDHASTNTSYDRPVVDHIYQKMEEEGNVAGRHLPSTEEKESDQIQILKCSSCNQEHMFFSQIHRIECLKCHRNYICGFKPLDRMQSDDCPFCMVNDIESTTNGVPFSKIVLDNIDIFSKYFGIPKEILTRIGSTLSAPKSVKIYQLLYCDCDLKDGICTCQETQITDPVVFGDHGWNPDKNVFNDLESLKLYFNGDVIHPDHIKTIVERVEAGFIITCNLCFDDEVNVKYADSLCRNKKCGYLFCHECIQRSCNMIRPKEPVMISHISCPYCRKKIHRSVVKRYAPKNDTDVLIHAIKNPTVSTMVYGTGQVRLCENYGKDPDDDDVCCGIDYNVFWINPEPEACAGGGELDHYLCSDCELRRHERILKELQRQEQLRTPQTDQNDFFIHGEMICRMCPKCQTITSHEGGCFHMTCYRCHAHFCWLCGESHQFANDTYEHLKNVHGGYYPPTAIGAYPGYGLSIINRENVKKYQYAFPLDGMIKKGNPSDYVNVPVFDPPQ